MRNHAYHRSHLVNRRRHTVHAAGADLGTEHSVCVRHRVHVLDMAGDAGCCRSDRRYGGIIETILIARLQSPGSGGGGMNKRQKKKACKQAQQGREDYALDLLVAFYMQPEEVFNRVYAILQRRLREITHESDD